MSGMVKSQFLKGIQEATSVLSVCPMEQFLG